MYQQIHLKMQCRRRSNNLLEGTAEISNADIQTKIDELRTADANKANLKSSAKAKLVAGEPLTEEEANTIVL